MPLVKRAVEPVFVSRATLDSKIKNELEGVVVNTLAGLIKQLSSVSKHAENLFGDLVNEANGIYLRTVSLSARVQGLQDGMSQLDSGDREDSKYIYPCRGGRGEGGREGEMEGKRGLCEVSDD